ncbi:MAG: hypothetical protein ACK5MT_18475 [Actinomycetales bacterium]
MAQSVLITGSTAAIDEVADAISAAGGTPVVARTAQELTVALADTPDGSLKHYVQLPTSVVPQGSTVTTRVHNFLVEGLLARYRASEAVLPALADDAHVVLVSGNVNTESAAPDDRAARLSLVHVLKHAMIADKGSTNFTVEVAMPGTTPRQVATAAMTGKTLGDSESSAIAAVDPGLDYVDWRTEMLGAMRSEF